ncbi:MAG: flagellar biosynthesis protein FlhA [Eubacteriales bacterium]|nr:flagellar biosynthesis protein FlhA [Eubacteriales bacterium]
MKPTDLLVGGGVFLIIILILVPLDPMLLDFFLIINISLSIIVLLYSMFTKETLEFSAFPSLLLILTLFRLSLNISSTRLILGNGGEAGAVIQTFGSFVIGGNLAVGVIIFAIIIIIQFMVITKGAERVAEVAARFTLDAMPGKQMAIDADLNAGLIDEIKAKKRREKIQREADFYGSMDGASKFVKGDAIVGILITVINIIGGIVIGMLTSGLPIGEVIQIYTLATVGDGLVSQLPALLITTATGILVTRSVSENNLGRDIIDQMSAQPTLLIFAGSMLMALALIPGLPKLSIFALAFLLIGLGLLLRQRRAAGAAAAERAAEPVSGERQASENLTDLLGVDPVELELGFGLIGLADPAQGGDLPERIVMIRRQFATDLGLILPGIRLHDNILLKSNEYVLRIRGEAIGQGEVLPDYLMALQPEGKSLDSLKGIAAVDPAFGLPARWISKKDRDKAELLQCTIIDPTSVIATHLSELLKRHSHELLDRQQVQSLVDHLRKSQPVLCEEVFPKLLSLGDLQKVLAGLLREGVPIRDMGTIVETMADQAAVNRHPDFLVEQVRQRLKRVITRRHAEDNRLFGIALDPTLEQLILEKVRQTEHGSFVALAPDQVRQVFGSLKQAVAAESAQGRNPVVLAAPSVRPHFKRLAEPIIPDLTVLSYNEIDNQVEILAERMVSLNT